MAIEGGSDCFCFRLSYRPDVLKQRCPPREIRWLRGTQRSLTQRPGLEGHKRARDDARHGTSGFIRWAAPLHSIDVGQRSRGWTDKAIISLVHLYVLITQFTIAGRARLLIKVTLISDYLNSINLIFDAIRRAQNPGPLSLYECY